MLEPGILVEYSVTELQLAEEQVVLEKKTKVVQMWFWDLKQVIEKKMEYKKNHFVAAFVEPKKACCR